MKRITIKDLAKMLNLSTSTISRALSNHPDISDKTKARVNEVAEQFNYTTNMHARLFRKQHSGLIALILPEVNMFFVPNLIKGINNIIDASKYSLIIFLTNDDLKKEIEIIKQCVGWAVEGILLSISRETTNLKHLDILKQNEIKTIVIDRTIEDEAFHSVTIDSSEASFTATNYLIQNGHTDILGIFGSSNLSLSQQRINGFKQALTENNLPVKKENIISVFKGSELNLILPTIFNHNKSITSIFAMSDELLAKALYNINAVDLRVPEDISIMSISDGEYPYLAYPNISHIKDSGSKMGRIATKLLIQLIEEESVPKIHKTKISTKLIELDSIKIINEKI